VSLWVKKFANENPYERIFGFNKYSLDMAINNSQLYYYATNIWHNTGVTVNGSTWYHIVLTHSSVDNINKVYVNGILIDTYTHALSSSTGMFIGCNYKHKDKFIGIIDELGVWDKVLTSTDVSALYNSGNALSYPFN